MTDSITEREREYNKAYNKKYYAEHKEKISGYIRNPEKDRKYYRTHKQTFRNQESKRRARKNGVEGTHFTKEEFQTLCDETGNKCLCCGRTGIPLTADHVIPLVFQVPRSDEISNIQPLCLSCNSRKGAKTVDYRNLQSLEIRND
jgi:5-methylcytosine-specific restriction endonuclease McrA